MCGKTNRYTLTIILNRSHTYSICVDRITEHSRVGGHNDLEHLNIYMKNHFGIFQFKKRYEGCQMKVAYIIEQTNYLMNKPTNESLMSSAQEITKEKKKNEHR